MLEAANYTRHNTEFTEVEMFDDIELYEVEVSPFWSRWPDIIAEIRHNGLYKFEVG